MAQQVATNDQLLEELTRLRQLLSQSTLSQGSHQYQNVTADGYSQVLLGDVHHHHYYRPHQQPLREGATSNFGGSSLHRQYLGQTEPHQNDRGAIERTEACLRRLYNLATDEDVDLSPGQTDSAIKDLTTLLRGVTITEKPQSSDLRCRKLVEGDLDRVISIVQLTREIRKEGHERAEKQHINESQLAIKDENERLAFCEKPQMSQSSLKAEYTQLDSETAHNLRNRRTHRDHDVVIRQAADSMSNVIARLVSGTQRVRVTKRNTWQVNDTKLSLNISKNVLYDSHGIEEYHQEHSEDLSATVIITSTSQTLPNKRLVFQFQQRAIFNITSILPSTLIVSNTLHHTSPIFGIACYGSVKQMVRTFDRREASMRDCDEYGKSLLGYALFTRNTAIVDYLLLNGADVDAYEYVPWEEADVLRPVIWNVVGRIDLVGKKRKLNNSLCIKSMLRYGSDPTNTVNVGGELYSTTAEIIIGYHPPDTLRGMLDHGHPFVSPNDIIDGQAIPLLRLAAMHILPGTSAYQIADKIALMLHRGANVRSSTSGGKTCLHIVMEYHLNEERMLRRLHQHTVTLDYDGDLKDILMLFLTAGADIHAKNDLNETPSEIAFEFNHWREWTDALRECGYDLAEIDAEEDEESGCWASGTDIHTRILKPKLMSFAEYLEIRKERASRIVEVCESDTDGDEDESVDDADEDGNEHSEGLEEEMEAWSEDVDWSSDGESQNYEIPSDAIDTPDTQVRQHNTKGKAD